MLPEVLAADSPLPNGLHIYRAGEDGVYRHTTTLFDTGAPLFSDTSWAPSDATPYDDIAAARRIVRFTL